MCVDMLLMHSQLCTHKQTNKQKHIQAGQKLFSVMQESAFIRGYMSDPGDHTAEFRLVQFAVFQSPAETATLKQHLVFKHTFKWFPSPSTWNIFIYLRCFLLRLRRWGKKTHLYPDIFGNGVGYK